MRNMSQSHGSTLHSRCRQVCIDAKIGNEESNIAFSFNAATYFWKNSLYKLWLINSNAGRHSPSNAMLLKGVSLYLSD